MKLSKKEENEPATKGFLIKGEYITKDSLEEILEKKNYVTETYMNEMVTSMYETFQKNIETYMQVLMEENHHKIMFLIESFNNRFEKVENRLEVVESKVL